MRNYEAFAITGVVNDTAWHKGLKGTEAEPKKLIALILFVTGQIGNIIQLDVERKTRLTLYDYHIDTDEQNADANTPKSATKRSWFDIDIDLPAGKTAMVGIACGATAKNVFGAYVYEMTK